MSSVNGKMAYPKRADDRAAETSRPSAQRELAKIHAFLAEIEQARPRRKLAPQHSTKANATIELVLDAGRRTFMRHGIAGFSLRKVAEDAGVAVGNINYYFETRQDLIDAILGEELAHYADAQRRQIAKHPDDPLNALLDIVEYYIRDGCQSYPLFFHLWGYAGTDDRALRIVREIYQSAGRLVYYLARAANPALRHDTLVFIVMRIFNLQEGVKLLIGLQSEDAPPIDQIIADARAQTRRMVSNPAFPTVNAD